MMANTKLSTRVKELRSKRGLSQDQLAEMAGLSLRTVQRGDTLSRLASALQVNAEEIIELQNHKNDSDCQENKDTNAFF